MKLPIKIAAQTMNSSLVTPVQFPTCYPAYNSLVAGFTGYPPKAKENLVDVMLLFIESFFERDVLDSVPKDCGLAPLTSAIS